jgi:AraC-like DNA-binding protein
MSLNRLGLLLAFFTLSVSGWAQIRLEVAHPAPLAVADRGLYLAASFNNWNPGDPRLALTRQPDGSYVILLPDSLRRFEYKFTQGSWQFTEGNAQGESIPNRLYERTEAKTPQRIQVTVAGWEQRPAYHFVVTELPSNTPEDAALYITGTFNKWNPADSRYRLRKQPDGTYRITVYSDLPRLEYKFTRGSWPMVESRDSGKSRPNRRIARAESKNLDIDVTIRGWEDLSSSLQFYSVFDLVMLVSVVLGGLLVVALPVRRSQNQQANRWLLILIGLSSFFVLLKIVSGYRDVANAYPKLLLLPDFIWFLYAPLFYVYLRRLLLEPVLLTRNWLYRFLPVVLHVFAYLPYFLMDSKVFQLKLVNQDVTLRGLFLVLGFLALVLNIGYWLFCRRLLRTYHRQTGDAANQSVTYLNTVLSIQAICLTLWLFLYGLTVTSRFTEIDILALSEQNIDTIWLIFSTLTYFLSYVAIRQSALSLSSPEPSPINLPTKAAQSTISLEAIPVSNAPNHSLSTQLPFVPAPLSKSVSQAPSIDVTTFLDTVEAYMTQHKPYTNPNLTIHELASGLKMTPHLLSRVINEGFGKNFFDFVNQYRVDELKRRMNDPHARHQTLLSMAFDVGFNSKTAFNRAFKKLTQQTPKEYFQTPTEEHAD